MLGRIGAAVGDSLGTGQGENCRVIGPAQFAHEATLLSYLLPDEVPYVMLISYKEEYIFTDTAFISVKGHSTIGTKKHVTRYDYCECFFSQVGLRTPGIASMDMDGTLTFEISGVFHEIDIRKAEWEAIKPLYRTLIRLQRAQHQNLAALALQKEMLPKIWVTVQNPAQLKDAAISLATESIHLYNPVSFQAIWQTHGN